MQKLAGRCFYTFTDICIDLWFFSEHVAAILPLLMLKKKLEWRSNVPIIFPHAVGWREKEYTGRGRMVRCFPFEFENYFGLFLQACLSNEQKF